MFLNISVIIKLWLQNYFPENFEDTVFYCFNDVYEKSNFCFFKCNIFFWLWKSFYNLPLIVGFLKFYQNISMSFLLHTRLSFQH